MVRTVLIALVLLTPLALAEGPTDGDCDDTGKLVCAGANVGARVECWMATPTAAKCAYTWGDVWTAYSPVGLPGEARGQVVTQFEACADVCAGSQTTTPFSCEFVGLEACDGGAGHEDETPLVALAMGQCLRVTVTQVIDVEASVARGVATLAETSWRDANAASGAVCLVDDGR